MLNYRTKSRKNEEKKTFFIRLGPRLRNIFTHSQHAGTKTHRNSNRNFFLVLRVEVLAGLYFHSIPEMACVHMKHNHHERETGVCSAFAGWHCVSASARAENEKVQLRENI